MIGIFFLFQREQKQQGTFNFYHYKEKKITDAATHPPADLQMTGFFDRKPAVQYTFVINTTDKI